MKRIVSIVENEEFEDVIDIETETHTFIANGLVSHNSSYQPSLDQFGKDSMTFMPSSPFTKIGKFYELYVQGSKLLNSYSEPDQAFANLTSDPEMLIIQLPSWTPYEDFERGPELVGINFKRAIQYSPVGDAPENLSMARKQQADPQKFSVERCLDPTTRILKSDLTWVKIDNINIGDEVIAMDEFPNIDGRSRKLRNSIVTDKFDSFQDAFRITFEDGSHVVCSSNHKWFSTSGRTGGARGDRTFRWRSIGLSSGSKSGIKAGDAIRMVVDPWTEVDTSYASGYLAGVYDGEGTFHTKARRGFTLSFPQRDNEVLAKTLEFLWLKDFSPKNNTSKRCDLSRTVRDDRGVLVGDAQAWNIYGFSNIARFVATIGGPKIRRQFLNCWVGRGLPKSDGINGQKSTALSKVVKSVVKLDAQRLVDITTTSGTFIAEGLISHNSAQFADVVDGYLDPEMVDQMFAPFWNGRVLKQQTSGDMHIAYTAHADPAKVNDNFSLAIGHIEQAPEPDKYGKFWNHVIIDYTHVWKPTDFSHNHNTIDYVQVEHELEGILDKYRSLELLTFDQYNSISLIQMLTKYSKEQKYQTRIREETFTAKSNKSRDETFKMALNLGWIHAPEDRLFNEGQGCLLSEECKFLTSKNGKVDHQSTGPVTTNDLYASASCLVERLLGKQVNGYHDALNQPIQMGLQGGVNPISNITRETNNPNDRSRTNRDRIEALRGWGAQGNSTSRTRGR